MEMNRGLIADSSGIVSLVTETDRNHPAAVRFARGFIEIAGSVLVPSDVLSESLNVLGKKAGHEAAIKTAEQILQSEAFVVVYPDDEIVAGALALFREQPGSVSFTDCMVMATADFYGTKELFAFDEVFEKNGYCITPSIDFEKAA